MYTYISKKISVGKERLIEFVRKNLSQIVIIVGVFTFLEVIKSFPYVNLIPSYQFLTIGLVLLLIVIFFKVFISNRNIVVTIIVLFIVAIGAAILDQKILEDLIGFIIYILLLITLRQVFRDRKELKKETME